MVEKWRNSPSPSPLTKDELTSVYTGMPSGFNPNAPPQNMTQSEAAAAISQAPAQVTASGDQSNGETESAVVAHKLPSTQVYSMMKTFFDIFYLF